MSRRGLARHAARRDANEGEIRKRFSFHGWHTEQVSGKGLPDLLCWPRYYPIGQEGRRSIAVDVKTPKGTLKPAQVKKWTALHALGIPVYVVRTEADVDTLVGGTLAPWEPPAPMYAPIVKMTRQELEKMYPRKGDAAKAREEGAKRLGMGHAIHTQEERRCERCKKVIPEWRAGMCSDCDNHYTPPRSTPVDAAKEAEAFAAPDLDTRECGCIGRKHTHACMTTGHYL